MGGVGERSRAGERQIKVVGRWIMGRWIIGSGKVDHGWRERWIIGKGGDGSLVEGEMDHW